MGSAENVKYPPVCWRAKWALVNGFCILHKSRIANGCKLAFSGCWPSCLRLFSLWPALSGSAAAEALFYCPFLFAPSFPSSFSGLRSFLWPSLGIGCNSLGFSCPFFSAGCLPLICWAVVAACGLPSVVLLGVVVLVLAVVVLAPVQAPTFQAIVQYAQIAQFISCTFGYF